MPEEIFHADDEFGYELVVIFVEDGKVVPIEGLSPPEIDRGIVIHKEIADRLVPILKKDARWGKPFLRLERDAR